MRTFPACAVIWGIQSCSLCQPSSVSASSADLPSGKICWTKGVINGTALLPRSSIMPFCAMYRKLTDSMAAVSSLIVGSDTTSLPVGIYSSIIAPHLIDV